MRHIILLMLLLATFTATAGNVIRCQNSLIRNGDSIARLLIKCGKPMYVNEYIGKGLVIVRSLYYSFGQTTKIVSVRYGRVFKIETEQ